jgi:hypothetical protein
LAVTVDIPGVGTVVADNAAQDSTLSSILAAIKSQSGDGGAADSQGVQALNSRSRQAGSSITKLSGSFGGLSETVAATASGMSAVGRGMSSLMDSMTRSASRFGSITGESVSQTMGEINRVAGSMTRVLPGMLGKVANGLTAGVGLISGAMAKQADAYNTAAQSGFNFGYSMDNMRDISNAAGLSMTQLTKVMQQSADSMSLFGGGTNQGAREFARLNKIVRDQSGPVMLRMGIGFEEQGVRTAETIERLMLAGMSFDEVARSGDLIARETFKRAHVEGQLAKINGTTLQQEREKMKAAQKDVTLQATLFGANDKVRTQMTSLYKQLEGQFGPGMAKLALEIYKSGGAMSEAGALLTTQMPGLTNALKDQVGTIKQTGGETNRTFADMLAGLDPEALRREQGAMAELQSTASLAGVNMGTLSTVLEQSYLGLQKVATQVESGTIDRIIADQEKIFEKAGKVTTAMVNQQTIMQQAARELSMAMTDAISGPIGSGVIKTNQFIMGMMTNAAKGTGALVEKVNEVINYIDGQVTGTSATPQSSGGRGDGTAQSSNPINSGSLYRDMIDAINPVNTGTLTLPTSTGTHAMSTAAPAAITENQMSNMLAAHANAIRDGTLDGLADRMAKFGGAGPEDAAMEQIQSVPVSSSNVVSLSSQDRELLSQIAAGNSMIDRSVNSVGMRQLEALDEVKMNTG